MSESIFTLIGRQTRAIVDGKLDVAGGSISGSLTLLNTPTDSLHAVTKGYVDNVEASAVKLLDLGELEQFYGQLLASVGTVLIPKAEYDQQSTNGVVIIHGVSSPFSSVAITTTYSTPTEITYELTEVSNDGVNTLVSLQTTSLTESALIHLIESGNITLGSDIITFL
jgi:hypothetical protein